MDTINIKRIVLLEAIKKNRDAHEAEYKAALIVYREEAIKQLKSILNDAENGREFKRAINLPEPQSFTKDYDRAIAMLEMSIDDTINLGSHEFDHYVLDNWSWKSQVGLTNALYLSKK